MGVTADLAVDATEPTEALPGVVGQNSDLDARPIGVAPELVQLCKVILDVEDRGSVLCVGPQQSERSRMGCRLLRQRTRPHGNPVRGRAIQRRP